jgi:hypothetical protein
MFDSLIERDFMEGDVPGAGAGSNPMLAESWERTDDLTLEFQLREDVTFHNGDPMTAEDVKFTFDMAKNPETASLLASAYLAPVASGHRLEYVGLDADADMVETAAAIHDVPGTSFRTGDMRDELPAGPFDLYLSCGVPYSHLTPDEMVAVLSGIMARIIDAGRRAAIVVDVLGRYSIEWTPNWGASRWNYAMTFLEDTTERLEQPMTFYDQTALNAAISAALPIETRSHPSGPVSRINTPRSNRPCQRRGLTLSLKFDILDSRG